MSYSYANANDGWWMIHILDQPEKNRYWYLVFPKYFWVHQQNFEYPNPGGECLCSDPGMKASGLLFGNFNIGRAPTKWGTWSETMPQLGVYSVGGQ